MNFKNIVWFIKAMIIIILIIVMIIIIIIVLIIVTIILIIIIIIMIIIIIIRGRFKKKFNLSFVSGTHISMDLGPEKFLSQVDYKC